MPYDPGRSWPLLGPNGAGKTTAVRCVAGLLLPDAGHLTVDGHRPGTTPAQRATAYVPDSPALYPALTVEEHLRFRAQAHGLTDGMSERVGHAMEQAGVAGLFGQVGGTLSRGQQQRVMLAAAVLQDAALYVLDEPTVGLDPPGLAWLERWLRTRAEGGAAILVATHSLDFVIRLAHRAVLVVGGRSATDTEVPPDDAPEVDAWRQRILDLFVSPHASG